jgi:LysM repeat protein
MTGATHPPTEQYLYVLKKAYSALQRGDKRGAHRLAQKAIDIEPQHEEAWLVLAACASPHGSLFYLKQALKINPDSVPAHNGLKWALQRIPPAVIASSPDKQRVYLTPRHLPLKLFLAFGAILLICLVVWTQTAGRPAVLSFALSWMPPTRVIPSPTAAPTNVVLPPTIAPKYTPTPVKPRVATATKVGQPHPANKDVPAAATKAPAQNQASSTVYTVKRGDTLSGIAVRFDISVQDIMAANNLNNAAKISPNQKLSIPSKGASASAAQPQTSPSQSKFIIVDISEQILYAYQGDTQVYTFSISTGRDNTTLTGSYKILDKDPNSWSDPWGFWMPDWMGIYYTAGNVENGIHALPILKNGETLWGDQIGNPVSYGCIVLRPDDSKQLFSWAEVETPIEIRP